jgi:hypothetical protein
MGISFKVKKMKFTVAYRLPHSRNKQLAERAITQYKYTVLYVLYCKYCANALFKLYIYPYNQSKHSTQPHVI